MAYVSDSNLTQFWGLAKDYINAENGRFANWQKTEKAGAVTCWPVGGTELRPTVGFLFTETPPANGQPKAPDNPSTITGVTQAKVTRCGKNIITPFTTQTITTNGIAFTADLAAGTITADGTATANAFFSWGGGQTKLPKDVTITLSGCPSGGSNSTYYFRFGDGTEEYGNGNTFTIGNKNQCFAIKIFSGVTVSNLVFRPQLELGSTATAFEPYDGADYTIDLGGTYYGGSFDLATGLMTVTYASQIVDSTMPISASGFAESTSYYTVRFYLRNKETTPGGTLDLSRYACDRLAVIRSDDVQEGFIVYGNSIVVGLRLSKTTLGLGDGLSLDQVKPAVSSWLGNNPLFVVYPALNPTTISLSTLQIYSLAQPDKYTPRLNTVYTDASAIQVGYAKSPIRSEYELTQAIIATEGGE